MCPQSICLSSFFPPRLRVAEEELGLLPGFVVRAVETQPFFSHVALAALDYELYNLSQLPEVTKTGYQNWIPKLGYKFHIKITIEMYINILSGTGEELKTIIRFSTVIHYFDTSHVLYITIKYQGDYINVLNYPSELMPLLLRKVATTVRVELNSIAVGQQQI